VISDGVLNGDGFSQWRDVLAVSSDGLHSNIDILSNLLDGDFAFGFSQGDGMAFEHAFDKIKGWFLSGFENARVVAPKGVIDGEAKQCVPSDRLSDRLDESEEVFGWALKVGADGCWG